MAFKFKQNEKNRVYLCLTFDIKPQEGTAET